MSLSPSNPLYMDADVRSPDACSPDACSCKNEKILDDSAI